MLRLEEEEKNSKEKQIEEIPSPMDLLLLGREDADRNSEEVRSIHD
jgi:hypothetical protein